MTKPTRAAWVEPIASTLEEDRRLLIDFARSAPALFWIQSSVVEGWTNKDILAHLAGGNDMLVQTVLRSTVTGEHPDPAELAPDTDAENARRVDERRGWSVQELIAELERDGALVQGWLAQLNDDHEAVRPDGLGLTLGAFLRIVHAERHDLLHLEQLRASPTA